jgi:hypothetical protein
MTRGLFALGVGLWLAALASAVRSEEPDAQTADPAAASRTSAPWAIREIARHASPKPDAAATPKQPAADLPFLHLRVEFRQGLTDPKFHEFRITNRQGDTIAEPYGFHREKSVVVFEGDWKELRGLYLDGHGRRVPLAAEAVAKSDVPPAKPSEVQGGSRGSAGDSGPPAPLEGGKSPEKQQADPSGHRTQAGPGSPWDIDPPLDGDQPRGTPNNAAAGGTGPGSGSDDTPSRANDGSGPGPGKDGSGRKGGDDQAAAKLSLQPAEEPGAKSAAPDKGIENPAVKSEREPRIGRLPFEKSTDKQIAPLTKAPPAVVLYLACSVEGGKGRVYQVDESGRVLGIVSLPYAPTGIALHRRNGLVTVSPRDGGKLWRIDGTGRVATILASDPALTYPVDVAIASDSDTIVVADGMSHSLMATTIAGEKPRTYQKLEGPARLDRPAMSVAVTPDRHVLYGTDNAAGVYRFAGDPRTAHRGPLAPTRGAVAADTATLKWAATQSPDRILVYEGETLMKTLRLPSSKRFLGDGMLSFGPAASVVAAVRPADDPAGYAWFLQFGTETDEVNALFRWQKEPVLDFVVGPRMPWDGNSPAGQRTAPPFPR